MTLYGYAKSPRRRWTVPTSLWSTYALRRGTGSKWSSTAIRRWASTVASRLSRAIEASLDREQEDFELTVTSAGIGQPLRMLRQYRKLIGREVEVVLKEGGKLVATLTDATGEAITVEYQEKAAVEGKKRKELVTRRRELPLAEVKSTCEHLSFK